MAFDTSLTRPIRLKQVARHFQKRLQFASLKATKGYAALTFDVALPKLESELLKPSTSASNPSQPLPVQFPAAPLNPHQRKHSRTLSAAYPPKLSLYDSLLSPTPDALNGSTFSPLLSTTEDSLPTAKRFKPSPPPTKSPTKSALKKSSASNRPKHSRGNSLSNSVSFAPPVSSPPKPLSTSDPHFAQTANDFLAAVNALTSLTQPPLESGIPAPFKISPSTLSHTRTTVKPLEGEETDQSAAEMMLFLAASPSPQRISSHVVATAIPNSNGTEIVARKLFMNEEDGVATVRGMETVHLTGSHGGLGQPFDLERSSTPSGYATASAW